MSSLSPNEKHNCPVCKELLYETDDIIHHYYFHQLEGMTFDDRFAPKPKQKTS